MNTYYTAKDIEELAAKGTRQLVLSPGVFLTDFARETAQQLGIEVVRGVTQAVSPAAPAPASRAPSPSDNYNKPSACQHSPNTFSTGSTRPVNPPTPLDGDNSKTANKIIDLMGKVIKRGG